MVLLRVFFVPKIVGSFVAKLEGFLKDTSLTADNIMLCAYTIVLDLLTNLLIVNHSTNVVHISPTTFRSI